MKPRVAMVSRWGVTCGIDDYVRDLIEASSDRVEFLVLAARESVRHAPDAPWVLRDWDYGSERVDELLADLTRVSPDVLHIQFNWTSMRFAALTQLLQFAVDNRVTCILQLHATMDYERDSLSALAPLLKRIDLVIVHGQHDLDRLSAWGVESNVWQWQLGERTWPHLDRAKLKQRLGLGEHHPVVATFGFLQRRKGLLASLQAVELMAPRYPDICFVGCCAIHPRGFDPDYLFQCLEAASTPALQRAVALIPYYLPSAAAMALLQAADVIVLPYVDTPEGQSAAAKFCLAAGRPLVVSSEELFDRYRESVLTVEDVTPQALARAIESVCSDPALEASLAALAVSASAAFGWESVSAQYVERVRNLLGPA